MIRCIADFTVNDKRHARLYHNSEFKDLDAKGLGSFSEGAYVVETRHSPSYEIMDEQFYETEVQARLAFATELLSLMNEM